MDNDEINMDAATAEDDIERTTEELADIIATGNPVRVMLGEGIAFDVDLEGVRVWLAVKVEPERIADLASGLVVDELRLAIPDLRHGMHGPSYVDPAEFALLGRALAARATLTGGNR